MKSDTNDYDVLVYPLCKDIDELIIPSNIRIIWESAFVKSNIKKIEFPKDSKLEIIGKLAFHSSQITEISIPSTVTKICESAFERACIQNIKIPKDSKLEIIEKNAFFLSNINEIYIPSKVKEICKETFKACKNLQKVEIPENSDMQVICKDAFFASHLEQISFPRNLKELNNFYYCLKRLTKIIVSPLNNNFIFKDNKYLLTKCDPNNNVFDVLLFARRDIDYAKIPSNIKIISNYAFNKCKKLSDVDFSENSKIQVIGKYAFGQCKAIKRILIPSTVTKICEYAFYRCKGLESFYLSDNSKLEIGDEVLGFTDIRQLYISDVKLFNVTLLDSALILEFVNESMLDCFDDAIYFENCDTIIMVHVKTNNI